MGQTSCISSQPTNPDPKERGETRLLTQPWSWGPVLGWSWSQPNPTPKPQVKPLWDKDGKISLFPSSCSFPDTPQSPGNQERAVIPIPTLHSHSVPSRPRRETAPSSFSAPEVISSREGNKADPFLPWHANKTINCYHFQQGAAAVKLKIGKENELLVMTAGEGRRNK